MPQDPYAATAEADPYSATAEQASSAPAETKKKPPGYFTPENFQNLASEAGRREQQYQYVAAGAEAHPRGALARAGAGAMSGIEGITRVADQMAAGLMDPKTAVAFLVSKIDPALAGAYFMTQGAGGAKEAGHDIAKNGWTPENSERLLLSLSGIAGGAVTGESPKAGSTVRGTMKAGELVKSLKGKFQPFARKVTGTEAAVKQAVEKTAAQHTEDVATHKTKQAETIKDNLRTQRDARLKIEQDKIATVEKNRAIEAENAASRAEVARRGELAKTVDEQSVALGKSIEQVESKVYDAADKKFKDVRAKLGITETNAGPELPPEPLIATVKDVQTNVLRDIPENIKEFRAILNMEGEEAGPLSIGGGGEVSPGEPGYEQVRQAYVNEGLLEENKPLTWDKLQSLKSRLDARLRSRRPMNGDVKRGLFQTRDAVVGEMGKIAQQKEGASSSWQDARNFWRQMKEDFHEPTGPSGSGSPVAQALDAVDPKNIRQPFLTKQSGVGNRAIDILRKYPEYGGTEAAAQAEQMLRTHEQTLTLPKKASETPLKATPEVHRLPTDKPIPPRPETPTVDVKKVALAQIEKAATSWKTWSQWDARRIASSAMGEIIGQLYGQRLIGAGLGYTAGTLVPKYIGTLLDKPEVAAWLAETPEREAQILGKIPGVDKIKLTDGLTEMAVRRAKSGRTVVISQPAANLLGPKNIARIVAVGGMVAGSETQRKSKSLGQQVRDLNAIRSSNPAMPIGEEP